MGDSRAGSASTAAFHAREHSGLELRFAPERDNEPQLRRALLLSPEAAHSSVSEAL